MADEKVIVKQPEPKTVVAENKKNDGDVLVLVEGSIEHGGVGYATGCHVWLPSDAAQFHAALGNVKRVA